MLWKWHEQIWSNQTARKETSASQWMTFTNLKWCNRAREMYENEVKITLLFKYFVFVRHLQAHSFHIHTVIIWYIPEFELLTADYPRACVGFLIKARALKCFLQKYFFTFVASGDIPTSQYQNYN